MSSVRENLIAARALIDTPEKWTQGIMSLGGCYCAMGAIAAATGQPSGGFRWGECELALRRATPRTRWYEGEDAHPVVRFNDDPSTTHADIMALFDRAIAAQDATP